MTEQPNVVLIHGAFADGSSWSAVVEDLQANGYQVTAPQFPLTSLATTSRACARPSPGAADPPSSSGIRTAGRS